MSPISSSGPAINIWRGPEGVSVTVRLPGCSPDDVEITTSHNTLVIRGQRPEVEVGEGETRQRDERGTGAFVRTLELPFEIDAKQTVATFERGLLSIRLARPEEEQPQKIQIRSA